MRILNYNAHIIIYDISMIYMHVMYGAHLLHSTRYLRYLRATMRGDCFCQIFQ